MKGARLEVDDDGPRHKHQDDEDGNQDGKFDGLLCQGKTKKDGQDPDKDFEWRGKSLVVGDHVVHYDPLKTNVMVPSISVSVVSLLNRHLRRAFIAA